MGQAPWGGGAGADRGQEDGAPHVAATASSRARPPSTAPHGQQDFVTPISVRQSIGRSHRSGGRTGETRVRARGGLSSRFPRQVTTGGHRTKQNEGEMLELAFAN